jgi:hypothetical protein
VGMILTVLRPCYFLPIADCARAQASDITVLAETHQFSKQETIHRAAIKTFIGKAWLSVPVLHTERIGQSIQAARIDMRQQWKRNHLRSLELNYRNSPYFYWHTDAIARIVSDAGDVLNELLWVSTRFMFSVLDLRTRLIGSGALDHDILDRTDRAIKWLEACSCDTYLIPQEEMLLLDLDRLRKNKIQIVTHSSRAVSYHQQFGDFIPGLSSLDLLFNEGPDSPVILKKHYDKI